MKRGGAKRRIAGSDGMDEQKGMSRKKGKLRRLPNIGDGELRGFWAGGLVGGWQAYEHGMRVGCGKNERIGDDDL